MKLTFFVLIMCCLGLGACNTLHGFGKDVRIMGEQLENATDSGK